MARCSRVWFHGLGHFGFARRACFHPWLPRDPWNRRDQLEFSREGTGGGGEAGGGIAPSLIGTAILVGISSVVGVPLGVGVGIYLSELAGDSVFARCARLAINTFIGVPSIIVGIFIYFIMVKPTNTFSAVAGGLALGIIMIPIMARTAEDVLRLVPNNIREAGYALGASQWRVNSGHRSPGRTRWRHYWRCVGGRTGGRRDRPADSNCTGERILSVRPF